MADAIGEEDAIPPNQLKEKVRKHMEYAQRRKSKHLLCALLLLVIDCVNIETLSFADIKFPKKAKKTSSKEVKDAATEQAVPAATATTEMAAPAAATGPAMAAEERNSSDTSDDER